MRDRVFVHGQLVFEYLYLLVDERVGVGGIGDRGVCW